MLLASVACLAVGIGLMGWAAGNIATRSEPTLSPEFADSHEPTTSVNAGGSVTSTASAPASQSAGSASGATPAVRRIVYVKNPRRGDVLGILSLPTLGQKLPIIEGTRDSDLKKGVGHFAQSVMPGQKDNCVLSGHRDTFFARLGQLEKGDRVLVKTAAGSFTYKVDRIRIVDKDDRTIIVPTSHGVLTLSTCYPFNYVGAAPRRYVVSASLVAGE